MLGTLFAALSLLAAPQAEAPAAAKHRGEALLRKLEGQWSCAGAFASGKVLEADLTFSAIESGAGLRYSHIDRAPNAYRQDSFWGLDEKTGQFISAGFIGSRGKAGLNAVLYKAEKVTDASVTLVHQPLLSDPFAPNRFTYSIEDGKLHMVWEVSRGGEWKMGDFLVCERQSGPQR